VGVLEIVFVSVAIVIYRDLIVALIVIGIYSFLAVMMINSFLTCQTSFVAFRMVELSLIAICAWYASVQRKDRQTDRQKVLCQL